MTLLATGDSFQLVWKGGRTMDLTLIAPRRTSSEPPRVEIVEMELQPPDLEDVFLRLTGK